LIRFLQNIDIQRSQNVYFFGSSLNVVGNIQKEIFIFQNYIEMQDSIANLSLPEIIVDYLSLLPIKKVILIDT
jgi:hypothetical protein